MMEYFLTVFCAHWRRASKHYFARTTGSFVYHKCDYDWYYLCIYDVPHQAAICEQIHIISLCCGKKQTIRNEDVIDIDIREIRWSCVSFCWWSMISAADTVGTLDVVQWTTRNLNEVAVVHKHNNVMDSCTLVSNDLRTIRLSTVYKDFIIRTNYLACWTHCNRNCVCLIISTKTKCLRMLQPPHYCCCALAAAV